MRRKRKEKEQQEETCDGDDDVENQEDQSGRKKRWLFITCPPCTQFLDVSDPGKETTTAEGHEGKTLT